MKLTRAVLVILLFFATVVHSQTRDNGGRTPESVVDRFCRLDQEGALLSDDGIRRIQPNLMWLPTPKWLNLYVVRGSRILDSKLNGSHDAEVTVEYDRLGYIKNGKFEPARATRRSTYQLQLTDHEWQNENGEPVLKETEPRWRLRRQTQPHLSVAVAIRYLKQLQTDSADEHERAELQQQIDALEAAERIAAVTPAPPPTATTASNQPIR